MKLSLNKPIVFFDLETTGVNIVNDRIVEISLLKIHPNGNKESKTWLVNPTVKIPQETIDIHGITNEKVASEPTFADLHNEILSIVENCDLAGYNSNKFDIPLLAEEFIRCGIIFHLIILRLLMFKISFTNLRKERFLQHINSIVKRI